MKQLILLIGLLLVTSTIFGQNGAAPLSKGDIQLNFGTGASTGGLPVYAGVDFAIHDDITLGPVIKLRIDDDISFGALFRGDYHFNKIIGIPDNFDFYAGANVGVFFGDDIDFWPEMQVGGRWYWSDDWGMNLEFGGGTGFGTSFGLSMKF